MVKFHYQNAQSHGPVLGGCDITQVSVEAEIEADVATGKANDGAPEEVRRGKLVEEVVVDDVCQKWKQISDEWYNK